MAAAQATASATYSFASTPQPVTGSRPKYRDEKAGQSQAYVAANLMYDPRVARGVTSGKPIPAGQFADTTRSSKEESKTAIRAQKAHKQNLIRTGKIRPPVKAVKELHENITVHKPRVEVPLHLYLVDQEEATKTANAEMQTDAFQPAPPKPEYIPRKTGVDVASQVAIADVFDYDVHVQPILQVVIDKILEQSLMEVREEEELLNMRVHKKELEVKREGEDKVSHAREDEERRQYLAKEKRLAEAKVRSDEEKEAMKRVASKRIAQAYLKQLENRVIDNLTGRGLFVDPTVMEVQAFFPWLLDNVTKNFAQLDASAQAVDDLVRSAIERVQLLSKEAERRRQEEAARLAAEAEAKRLADEEQRRRTRKLQLFIHTTLVANSPVGPINITANSTVAQVEEKIIEWLQENVDDPPEPSRLKFLWNGQLLNRESILYDIGVDNAATIQMQVEEPPKPVEEEGEGEEGEEEEQEEESDGDA